MVFEQFSQGNSLLHQAHPGIKIISTALLSLTIALCQNFLTAGAGLLLAVALLLVARLPLALVWHRLLIVNSFNVLLWLLLPVTYGGDQLFAVAGIGVSRSGLLLAALITVKANAILLLFISLLATSSVARLGHALQKMGLSAKLSVLLLFSYRYIDVIHQEYQRLQRAAVMRCFQPGTNLHTYKTYSHLLGMLLVKSWNRAARVEQAMVLRGFSGSFHSLHEQTITGKDRILLAGLLSTWFILLWITLAS